MLLPCLRFDKFLLCSSERIVICDGIKLDIRGKEFDVLHLLLRSPKLVTKDVFLQEVWGDVSVEESNIAVCVSNIRGALKAHSSKKLIETVHKHGYRLLVEVVETVEQVEIADSKEDKNSRNLLSRQSDEGESVSFAADSDQKSKEFSSRHSFIGSSRLLDWIRLSLVVLTIIFLCIGAFVFLVSDANTFSMKPFFPCIIPFAMYVLIEFFQGTLRMLPSYNMIAFALIAVALMVTYFAVNAQDRDRKTAYLGIAGLIFGFGGGLLVGKLLLQSGISKNGK